jgi:hypothetical protein
MSFCIKENLAAIARRETHSFHFKDDSETPAPENFARHAAIPITKLVKLWPQFCGAERRRSVNNKRALLFEHFLNVRYPMLVILAMWDRCGIKSLDAMFLALYNVGIRIFRS